MNEQDEEFDEFITERHHHLYGRPWAVGRGYFNFLRNTGIRPGDCVLDFGCGAGRVGIWLIGYLERGRYVGIEPSMYALAAFERYEIPLHGLQDKEARLIQDTSGEPHRLGIEFDAILDLAVTRHFTPEEAVSTYQSFAKCLRSTGRIFTNGRPKVPMEVLQAMNLNLVHSERRENWVGQDFWHVLTPALPGKVKA
jgi:cyclopropane fatty-acyl-phospholipid synthase-like methyltransferase